MKILLIAFSGSGNTFLCGDFLKKYFVELGHECDFYKIRKDEPLTYDISKYDLIGFGYPIHAFNTPQAFNNFIKKLPKLQEKKNYFIFKVSGEPFALNNASSYHFAKKLKRRNFVRVGEKHFIMPYNIMFRYKDSLAKQMYLYLDSLCKAYVLELVNNEGELIKYSVPYVILSFLLRIEWIAPKLNAPFVRIKKDKCIDCHKCIHDCPCSSIYINKKGNIRIKTSCTMCMKCAMNCPSDAIIYGFMNPWKVNGPYDYSAIVANKDIEPEFVNKDTKGYFKKFNKYFNRQKALLEKYQIPNPIEEYLKA